MRAIGHESLFAIVDLLAGIFKVLKFDFRGNRILTSLMKAT